MTEWKVTSDESGMKLLEFIKNKMGEKYSGRQLKKGIEQNLCLINGRAERFASATIGKGDSVVFNIDDLSKESTTLSIDPSRVLFEDKDLLIYDKPSGIASDDESFLKAMENQFPGAALVHRLDRDTTGVLIFARNKQALLAMMNLFKGRAIKKTYLAVVDGPVRAKSGTIENYLGKLKVYQGQAIWGEVSPEKGLYAKTEWVCDRKGKEASVISCYPETGRTHQIRVHLSGIGHPILGDFQYGRRFRCKYKATRCLLHASEIAFSHPINSKGMQIEAPIPEDLLQAIKTVMSP